MKISKFNNSLMYSNKNIEKMMRKIINESCNAVLLETFSDKCILADHKTGSIYSAEYAFDGKVLTLEGFEEIELEKDTDNLSEAIGKYFDDEEVDLAEAYESTSSFVRDIYEDSIVEALASKNMSDIIDYSELAGINEEIEELKETEMYSIYEARLEEKPSSTIKMFDWVNPVRVSLIDEDEDILISSGLKAKGKTLKSNREFKLELNEAAEEFINGDSGLLENVIDENRAILSLNKSSLKELVGLSVIGNKTLMENRNAIVEEIENIISENDEFLAMQNMINEEDDEEESKDTECDSKSLNTLKNALEKAAEKVSDEKLLNKINSLIDDIDACSETETTAVGTVKEAISLLKL